MPDSLARYYATLGSDVLLVILRELAITHSTMLWSFLLPGAFSLLLYLYIRIF